MEGAVPHRLHTLAHPLEALLLGFTRSTTCGVLQINGFGIASVPTGTPHNPLVIRGVITLWYPRAILARKPVGPFNLNRGQYSSLPTMESSYGSSMAATSTNLCDVACVDCPVQRTVITGAAPTSPFCVAGHWINSGYQCSDCT